MKKARSRDRLELLAAHKNWTGRQWGAVLYSSISHDAKWKLPAADDFVQDLLLSLDEPVAYR